MSIQHKDTKNAKRTFFFVMLVSLCWKIAAGEAGYAQGLERYEYRALEMGTEFHIVLYAPSRPEAWQAAQAALERIRDLDQKLSDYRENSEISRLCRRAHRQPVVASPELFYALEQSFHYFQLSDGAFDVTIKPLVDLWRQARQKKQLPSPDEIDLARRKVGFDKVDLRPETREVRLETRGVQIDFGGIGKGYAADEALAALRRHGISRALIDAGGDIRLGDPPPGETGWKVAADALDSGEAAETMVLSNSAVATSSDQYQFVEIEGVRYSHIVDPATGLGLRERRMVTVIAPDGITADALATTFSILPPKEALALAESMEGVAVRIIAGEGREKRRLSSKHFPRAGP